MNSDCSCDLFEEYDINVYQLKWISWRSSIVAAANDGKDDGVINVLIPGTFFAVGANESSNHTVLFSSGDSHLYLVMPT